MRTNERFGDRSSGLEVGDFVGIVLIIAVLGMTLTVLAVDRFGLEVDLGWTRDLVSMSGTEPTGGAVELSAASRSPEPGSGVTR